MGRSWGAHGEIVGRSWGDRHPTRILPLPSSPSLHSLTSPCSPSALTPPATNPNLPATSPPSPHDLPTISPHLPGEALELRGEPAELHRWAVAVAAVASHAVSGYVWQQRKHKGRKRRWAHRLDTGLRFTGPSLLSYHTYCAY